MIPSKLRGANLWVACSAFGLLLLLTAGAVLAASNGGHGEGGGIGWEATDTYRVMNFVALVAILFFILRKPVKHFFNDRIRVIKEQLADLENQKKAAEQELAEYNDRLAALSQESEKIIEQYRQQGESVREKILKEAENAANKLEDQARRNIEREFAQAKKKLESEVFEKAIEKAEEKLKRVTTPEDQDKLVQEYLDKVVTK
ncbi:MAG: ATP synthase F0 subunit B [Desulfobacteraceae bacterium]|nr:ATP synthase F0 subunit B [Desulfobacteraceae bacterium]